MHGKHHLVVTLTLLFLVSDVSTHHLLVQSYRENEVTSGPEVLAREVPLSAPELACDLDRALPLMYPTTFDTAYFGGMLKHMWT